MTITSFSLPSLLRNSIKTKLCIIFLETWVLMGEDALLDWDYYLSVAMLFCSQVKNNNPVAKTNSSLV